MILGCDVVGEVVQIGSEVPAGQVQLGELRWTFMNGGMSEERGGFAEYDSQIYTIARTIVTYLLYYAKDLSRSIGI